MQPTLPNSAARPDRQKHVSAAAGNDYPPTAVPAAGANARGSRYFTANRPAPRALAATASLALTAALSLTRAPWAFAATASQLASYNSSAAHSRAACCAPPAQRPPWACAAASTEAGLLAPVQHHPGRVPDAGQRDGGLHRRSPVYGPYHQFNRTPPSPRPALPAGCAPRSQFMVQRSQAPSHADELNAA